jgi:hypothetical protein
MNKISLHYILKLKHKKPISENKFIKELIKIEINIDKKKTIFETDEYPRSNLNLEILKN